MAFTTNTAWEVRDTGTTTGGAGFDPSFGGTDYSQQDNPQLTHNDGVISGTNLQSTLGGFTTQMKGNGVYLSVTQQWFQITAVVDGNNVTLDRAPGNSSGNTYNVGGAFKVTQNGFQFNYQPGNIIWWHGTIANTVNPVSLNSSSADKPVVLRGYGTVRGDSGYGTIQGAGVAAPTILVGSNAVVENMILDGRNIQTRAGIQFTSQGGVVRNCKVINQSSTANGVEILGNYNTLEECFIDTTGGTGDGIVLGTAALPSSGSIVRHNTVWTKGNGVVLGAGLFADVNHNVLCNTVAPTNKGGIVAFSGGSNWREGADISFNDIYNFGWGIYIFAVSSFLQQWMIAANIFSNNNQIDIRYDGTDISGFTNLEEWMRTNVPFNAFYNTVTRYQGLLSNPTDITLTADPFTNASGTRDFSLNDTAGGGADCKGAWVVTFPDGVNTGTYTLGALAAPVSSPPNAPTVLTGHAIAPTKVVLSWTDNSSNETGFQIERALTGGAFVILTTVGANQTTYADTSCTPATSYDYRVAAVNTAGLSAYTNTVTVIPPPLSVNIASPPSIDEIQFPPAISKGAQGGPMFSTIVAAAGNGTEQRLPQWSAPRYKWNIGAGLKNPTDFLVVFNFWINRKGKAHGFRLKDWDDYQATDELLVPDGTPYTQLIKTYSDTLLSYIRNIYKPVSGTVTLKRNSVSYTTFTLDTTTGVISHTALILKSITGITQAASAVVTVGSGHGFVIGDVVYITGVSGMTEINDATYTVTATATTTITLNVDSTGFTAYTSGGTCGKYVQPTDTLTWTGEFDVPVRFDIDEPQMVLEDVAARSWDNIPVIELRGSS